MCMCVCVCMWVGICVCINNIMWLEGDEKNVSRNRGCHRKMMG